MNRRMLRIAAAPLLVVGLGATAACSTSNPLDQVGCSEFSLTNFDAIASLDVDVKVKAFLDGAARLSALGDAMVTTVGDSCVKIATAGKAMDTWSSKTGDDRTTEACTQAKAVIDAALTGGVTLDVEVTGGHCDASIDAQAKCDAQCDASAMCTAAQIQASCEPGKLSGTCSGACTGSCDASGGSVMCAGDCSATCSGACKGECAGMMNNANCMGKCTGECDGSCNGTCSVVPPMVTCMGRCEGSCSVDFMAPHCEGKFTPPMCGVNADCNASCNASVQAQAMCTPPTVKITVNGMGGANLQAIVDALQTELPHLIIVATAQGKIAVESFADLVSAGANIKGAATSSAKALQCIGVAIEATAKASASVNVSVMASASVSASSG